jgi:hypothetical protein
MRNNREFLDEVFSSESDFQGALLVSALKYGRLRKRRRHIVSAAAITASVFCLALLPAVFRHGQYSEPRQPAPHSAVPEPQHIPGTDIRVINDEELLDLFSGRPVAFVGEGNQRRFLVLDSFRTPK